MGLKHTVEEKRRTHYLLFTRLRVIPQIYRTRTDCFSDALPVRRESQFRLRVAKRISASLLEATESPQRPPPPVVVFHYLTLYAHQAS